MMRLRSGLIGSMSAWLPSRRSTAHQRGAFVMRRVRPRAVGQSRRANCSWYGRYLWIGIPEGFWVFSMMVALFSRREVSGPTTSSATRKALERGLVAAAKKEKRAEAHAIRVHPVRDDRERLHRDVPHGRVRRSGRRATLAGHDPSSSTPPRRRAGPRHPSSLLSGCATPPHSGAGGAAGSLGSLWPAPPEGEVVGQGTVMDVGGEVELCLGAVAESYPPQCSGIPLTDWSWDGVDGCERPAT